jgi:hypothetical protein
MKLLRPKKIFTLLSNYGAVRRNQWGKYRLLLRNHLEMVDNFPAETFNLLSHRKGCWKTREKRWADQF